MSTDTTSDRPHVQQGDDLVMVMLEDHVPLSLLVDLTDPTGPTSAQILAAEGEPESSWWDR